MIFYDFEVYKYDWMIVYLDTKTRKLHSIINDKGAFERFYEKHKREIWVGYNSRGYDQWVAKAILCDFVPYDMNKFIIEDGKKGFMFSKLLYKFPILNYDCSVGFRSLKELEAFMGHDIRETTVPFDIDRKLTKVELASVLKYCEHDVMETFEVFMATPTEFESHMGLIKEFNLPLDNVSKTKAQMSASILSASKRKRDDEFCISTPDTLVLGKYKWIEDWYYEWAEKAIELNDQKAAYKMMELKLEIGGIPHTCGIGGLHGAIKNYHGTGYYVLIDADSYYPAMMIEYKYLSRNVYQPVKFRQIRDERIIMKHAKDPRQLPRKIVINATFGAAKDPYNNLYDPLQANNTCIAGQLLLIDLVDKVEGMSELIQSNTDGILVKLESKDDLPALMEICKEWEVRTRMTLGYEYYKKVVQKDVNNYIVVEQDGGVKRKGGFVKKLSSIDNDLPIVNRAIVDYFVDGIPVENTVMASDKMIDLDRKSVV